ncbi:repA, partial [Escherichia coli]|nr:repA [Escherichia coli]
MNTQNLIADHREKHDRENLGFTQVYPLGWKRLMALAKGNQGAFGLYTFLAQHIDGACGAVVADQAFLAAQFDVTTRTVRNWISYLEEQKAIV